MKTRSLHVTTWNAGCGLCPWTSGGVAHSKDEGGEQAQAALRAHLAAAHAMELERMGQTTTEGHVQ